jgi:hypothetical protein
MGLIDRLLGRADTHSQTAEPTGSQVDLRRGETHDQEPARSSSADIGLVTLSGTTTICRDAIASLVTRHGQADDGYLVMDERGQIERSFQDLVAASGVVLAAD